MRTEKKKIATVLGTAAKVLGLLGVVGISSAVGEPLSFSIGRGAPYTTYRPYCSSKSSASRYNYEDRSYYEHRVYDDDDDVIDIIESLKERGLSASFDSGKKEVCSKIEELADSSTRRIIKTAAAKAISEIANTMSFERNKLDVMGYAVDILI